MSVSWGANCRPPNRPSPSPHRLLFYSSIQESSQVALKRLLSRRLSARSEPVFEVPDPDLVFDLRLFDGDRDRRILMDPVDTIVLTKHVQSASYGFIETVRGDCDGMFRAVRVDTRHFASSQGHSRRLAFRFYFVQELDEMPDVGVVVVVVVVVAIADPAR
jgi:hypothetical protein